MNIIAHRGLPSQVPENTLKSFIKSVELGVDFIEFDVRYTLDKKSYVFIAMNYIKPPNRQNWFQNLNLID